MTTRQRRVQVARQHSEIKHSQQRSADSPHPQAYASKVSEYDRLRRESGKVTYTLSGQDEKKNV